MQLSLLESNSYMLQIGRTRLWTGVTLAFYRIQDTTILNDELTHCLSAQNKTPPSGDLRDEKREVKLPVSVNYGCALLLVSLETQLMDGGAG